MRVVDASFLIALCDVADPRRADALRRAADPAPIIVPREVLAETLAVVHRRQGFDAALAVWREVRGLPHRAIAGPVETGEVASLFEGGKGRLSWVDAAVVAHGAAAGAVPLSFDGAIEAAVRRARRKR